jgi:ribosomal protein L11 methyltransferase
LNKKQGQTMPANRSVDPWYWEVIADCGSEPAELITGRLFELGLLGIEELDDRNGRLRLKLYFGADDPSGVLSRVLSQTGVASNDFVIVDISRRNTENWQENWKTYFRPIAVGKRFLIRPPWEKPQPGKLEIVINPGQAFGTGYHESTSLALQLLESAAEQGPLGKVLDMGTGSGILALAALLLGAEQVTALDIDPSSEIEVRQNADLTGLIDPPLTLWIGTIESFTGTVGDLVIANIEDRILTGLTEKLVAYTRSGGRLLLSGILTVQREPLLQKLRSETTFLKEQQLGDWYAVVLRRN